MNIDIAQLEFIELRLREIALWLKKATGFSFTITSLYRINDKGVHGKLPLRAIDLRMRNKQIGREIESLINNRWMYDDKRPALKCAVLHGKGMNLHLHLQTHPNTIRR